MSKAIAPYGSWESPLTANSFAARSVVLSQVRVDGADIYWVEGSPQRQGRGVLLRRDALGQTSEVLPLLEGTRLVDVTTHVHEYGGRAYSVKDGLIVFSDGLDNRVYLYDTRKAHAMVHPLTQLSKRRYGDFFIDDARGMVYAVQEDHTAPGEPVNTLVAIPLDGSAHRDRSRIVTVFEGTDFVSSPTLSPDGDKLAWLTWNHPEMPWTKSELHVASLDRHAAPQVSVVLVDRPGVCVYEPRWTLDGDLIHIDDSTGWASMYRTEGFTSKPGQPDDAWAIKLRTRALHPGRRAFSHPHWLLGLHSYDNLDHDHLICSWHEESSWHLGTMRLDNGLLEEWETGWWPVGNVAAADERVVFLGDSPTQTSTIVSVEGPKVRVVRSSTISIDQAYISPAKPVAWPTRDGAEAYGYYYQPSNVRFEGPEDERPPLIVMVHGGPTDAFRPGLDLGVQYWTTRGFAVLAVNYRGSTGYGREYRTALDGNYGVMDVTDCVDGVTWLVESDLVDPKRVAIRGASSGGFTVLAALTSTDVFSAGTSRYGMSDLRKIAQDTHKFELTYAQLLLQSDDLSDPIWAERSPIEHIGQISAPLLLLQGTEDKVVPPNQTEEIYDELVELGKPVARVLFEGEGHGFRFAASRERAWRTELSFYARVWGIQIHHPVDVPLQNAQ